jgi:hypothetical protein
VTNGDTFPDNEVRFDYSGKKEAENFQSGRHKQLSAKIVLEFIL